MMKLSNSPKPRSRSWWVVMLCASLAMGVYVAFDILDLDGSTSRDLGPGTAIAAEPAFVEAERLLHQASATPETPRPIYLSPNSGLVPESPSVSPKATAVTFAPSVLTVRPPLNRCQELSSASSPADDPA